MRATGRGDLRIDPARIQWLPPDPGAPALERHDARCPYDLDNLAAVDAADVQAMLSAFSADLRRREPRAAAVAELELTEPVDAATVRRQYRRLVMRHHPDRGGEPERLQAINRALAVLLPRQRRCRSGIRPATPWRAPSRLQSGTRAPGATDTRRSRFHPYPGDRMTEPVSTSDLCDAHPERVRVLEPMFANFGGVDAFGGPAVTVKCFEDNSVVKELAASPGEGRVMVVDGGGSMRRALMGDQVAAQAAANGWAGALLFGCVRDVDELAVTALGIQALGSVPVKTDKRGIGDRDVPVTFGGVTLRAGDWVAADNDGVVVLDAPPDVA